MAKKLSPVEAEKLRKIMADPVTWAKSFLISNNAATKKYGPWIARDYHLPVRYIGVVDEQESPRSW